MKTTIVLATAIMIASVSFGQESPASANLKTNSSTSIKISGNKSGIQSNSSGSASVGVNAEPAVNATRATVQRTQKTGKEAVAKGQQASVPAPAVRVNTAARAVFRIH